MVHKWQKVDATTITANTTHDSSVTDACSNCCL